MMSMDEKETNGLYLMKQSHERQQDRMVEESGSIWTGVEVDSERQVSSVALGG
jgi:hypothetical protein